MSEHTPTTIFDTLDEKDNEIKQLKKELEDQEHRVQTEKMLCGQAHARNIVKGTEILKLKEALGNIKKVYKLDINRAELEDRIETILEKYQ